MLRALGLALLLSTTARADDPPLRSPAPVKPDGKSPTIALALSAGTTAAGLGLMFTNNAGAFLGGSALFLVGPSTGHWYAHDGVNLGMGIRLAGVAVVIVGLAQTDLSFGHDDTGTGDDNGAVATAIGGLALYGIGTAYEIVTAPSAVHAYNDDLALVPTRNGLALAGRF
jgi:hypothetical protein